LTKDQEDSLVLLRDTYPMAQLCCVYNRPECTINVKYIKKKNINLINKLSFLFLFWILDEATKWASAVSFSFVSWNKTKNPYIL